MLRINRNPSRTQLLVFAVAWFAVIAVFAWRSAAPRSGGLVLLSAAVAVLPLVLAPVSPNTLRWLFLGLSYATYPIGLAVSYLVLIVLFYVVVTPVGLLMRLAGRDPLTRKFDRSAATYWVRRADPPAPASYLRQR
jgi:hypothetical protein